jgi:hypothetical protein
VTVEGDRGSAVTVEGDRGDALTAEGDRGDALTAEGDRGDAVTVEGDRGDAVTAEAVTEETANLTDEEQGTGHPAVDAAVRAVVNSTDLPMAEQLAAYEGAHQTLREVLASIED